MSRICRFLCLAVLVSLSHGSSIHADQIELSNGSVILGTVVGTPGAEGVKIRLTRNGGEVFLRWSQFAESTARALRRQPEAAPVRMPVVEIIGARLELVSGEIIEGYIVKKGAEYQVTNISHKERHIPESEVEVFTDGIAINPLSVLSPDQTLDRAMADSPPRTARDNFTMAAYAQRLGLFARAKALCDACLASNPDDELQGLAETAIASLAEMMQQKKVFDALSTAVALARGKKFGAALAAIDNALKETKPVGAAKEQVDAVRADVDRDFSTFVEGEWYRQMLVVARGAVRKLGTLEAMAYARADMERDIIAAISTTVGGEAQDIRRRFLRRNVKALARRVTRFGTDGWYDVVGGPLPSAGRSTKSPTSRSDRDGVPDAMRQTSLNDERDGGDHPVVREKKYDPNDPKLKVPDQCPSLADWWAKEGVSGRSAWLVTYYVRYGGTMVVWEISYDRVYFS